MFIQVLCLFFSWVVCPIVVEFRSSVYSLGINPYHPYLSFANTFFQSLSCLIHLSMKVFNFDEVQFVSLLLLLLLVPLLSHPRNLNPKSWNFSPYIFFSKSFIVLPLAFRSLIHFEVIFVFGIRFHLHCFAYTYPVFPTPYIEKIVRFKWS